MIFSDTSFEKLCVRQAEHEGRSGATRRAPLAPEPAAVAEKTTVADIVATGIAAAVRMASLPVSAAQGAAAGAAALKDDEGSAGDGEA